MSGVWLVLPTYNEAENVERIVPAALAQFEGSGPAHRVPIVDGGSPDGTGALADRLADRHSAVQVLHRRDKEGLERAYLASSSWPSPGGRTS